MEDVGNEEQVEWCKVISGFEEKQEVEDLRWVLESRSGRAFMWRLLELICRIHQPSPTHPQETFRDIGRKDVGQEILNQCLTAREDSFILMQREAIERGHENVARAETEVNREEN